MHPDSRRLRVLYLLNDYPQVSETYVQTEIDALRGSHDIRIVSVKPPHTIPERHDPFEVISRDEPERLRAAVDAFAPDVLHGHWLHMAPNIGALSEATGVPFTIRAHSFDVLWPDRRSTFKRLIGRDGRPPFIRDSIGHLQSSRCLGILTFPFGRPALERWGVPIEKLFDAPPCLDFNRFHDTSANGDGVMNGGAALPKKEMDDFLDLASLLPTTRFDLYPVGYEIDRLVDANAARGSPVRITPNVEPHAMPPVYKAHRWLVYTASTRMPTTGWPVMIAEAQASGVGVVMRNLRPDLKDYVGPCGYLYDTLEEAAAIVSRPFPEEKRQEGFERARRHDIHAHKQILTDRWSMLARS